MNKHTHVATGHEATRPVRPEVGRRTFLGLTGAGVAAGVFAAIDAPALAQRTLAWDKTFPKSDRVDRTPRGQHPRATTAFSRTSAAPMMLFWSYQHLDWIAPRPVLFITGDRAHSRIFSEHAYSRASDPKELLIVPGAGHVDLYDRVDLIPWDKLQSFFGRHLGGAKGRS